MYRYLCLSVCACLLLQVPPGLGFGICKRLPWIHFGIHFGASRGWVWASKAKLEGVWSGQGDTGERSGSGT